MVAGGRIAVHRPVLRRGRRIEIWQRYLEMTPDFPYTVHQVQPDPIIRSLPEQYPASRDGPVPGWFAGTVEGMGSHPSRWNWPS